MRRAAHAEVQRSDGELGDSLSLPSVCLGGLDGEPERQLKPPTLFFFFFFVKFENLILNLHENAGDLD